MKPFLSREEEIFCDAIEIADETERQTFLEKQCGDDQKLRSKLEQLIRMHQTKGRILDGTTLGEVAAEIETVSLPHCGQQIGPYKLLQEIGEGGMGVVFMAEQERPVRRKVAIKIIKVGMDTRRVVARFESERQALALMDHPCITKVYDAGSTEAGRPYFVMELVKGKSITQYCDEKKVTIRKRLEIFEQVCHAVEHAHQKGIIHRDIKPSNIMVTSNDGIPLPKIIDFGIAKATGDRLTDKTLFTNYGEMIGTPLYMSPEQAEMSEPDVDTRSDIYSLGVLLYELLTGTTPFSDLKKKSFHAIRDAIRSRDPQIASTRVASMVDTIEQAAENRNTDPKGLHKFLRGDIDWILCKCLNRSRSERYQSAGEIAREIRRHLDGETVEAAAPTLRYRMQKFTARNKAAVAIAACLAFVLISSSIFSGVMAARANSMARKAMDAEVLANQRLQQVALQRDQIADLERQQRELAVLYEAAAHYNAEQMKKGVWRNRSSTKASTNNRPPLRFEKIQKVYGMNTPPIPGQHIRQMHQQRAGDPQPPGNNDQEQVESKMFQDKTKNWVNSEAYAFETPNYSDKVEIVIVPGNEANCKTEFYKNVFKVQQDRFGKDDPILAQTMLKIGESLNFENKFEESEKVLEQALQMTHQKQRRAIRKQVNSNQIRVNLAKSLSQQGKVKLAKMQLDEIEKQADVEDLSLECVQLIEEIKLEIKELEQLKGKQRSDEKSDQKKQELPDR